MDTDKSEVSKEEGKVVDTNIKEVTEKTESVATTETVHVTEKTVSVATTKTERVVTERSEEVKSKVNVEDETVIGDANETTVVDTGENAEEGRHTITSTDESSSGGNITDVDEQMLGRYNTEGAYYQPTELFEDISEPKEEQDIVYLVRLIQRITTLYDLNDGDWNTGTIEVIEDFLQNANENLLTIYFDEDELKGKLDFPTVRFTDIQYFARKRDGIEIRKDNFYNVIVFGTLDEFPEQSIFTILNRIYSPMFRSITTWPETVQYRLTTAIDNFIFELNNLKHHLMTITGLYIPSDVVNVPIDKAVRNLSLIRRVESTVLQWYTLIKNTINSVGKVSPQDNPHPIDEYHFWIGKYENTCGIWDQVTSPDVAHLCKILIAAQSPYVHQFLSILDDIKKAKERSRITAQYLQVLVEPCKLLEEVVDPLEVPHLVPAILNRLKFIWARAPYYNTDEDLLQQCITLSNQIIQICKGSMDFKVVFDYKPVDAISMFENVVACCKDYKALYQRAVTLHNTYHTKPWNVAEEKVFDQIDNLSQRCSDMVEICHTMTIYGRIDETREIPKPSFHWSRAYELDRIITKIERSYWACFEKLQKVQDSFLQLYENDWSFNMLQYHEGIREIEVIVENLVTSIFKTLTTIEESIDVTQVLYQYTKRPVLMPFFSRRSNDVYKFLFDECLETKREILTERENMMLGIPRYAGRTMISILRRKRLERMYNRLEDAYWMVEGSKLESTVAEYQSTKELLEGTIERHYAKWISKLFYDVDRRLKKPLFRKSKSGILVCNLDKKLMRLAAESDCFSQIEFGIPPHGIRLISLIPTITTLKSNLKMIILDYNNIITWLSATEKLLFSQHLAKIECQIGPGLEPTLNWLAEHAEVFISDCQIVLREFREFVEDYKKCNVEIERLCKKIAMTSLVNYPSSHVYDLHRLETTSINYRIIKINELVDCYNNIIKYILVVYEGFAHVLPKVRGHWLMYIGRIDKLIQEALRVCARKTMKAYLEAFKVVSSTRAENKNILLNISVGLKQKEVTFHPTFLEIVCFVKNCLPDIIIEFKVFPRLFDKFHIKLSTKKIPYAAVIALDDFCRKCQYDTETEVGKAHEQTIKYLAMWDCYKDVFEIDRDKYLQRFEKRHPNAQAFQMDMDRFELTMQQVSEVTPRTFVHFLNINAQPFKDKIVRHCNVWQNRLSMLLMKMTAEQIEDVYEYCHRNTKRLNTEPRLLKHLPIARKYHAFCIREAPIKELQFPALKEQLELLQECRDDIPEIMFEREAGITQIWKEYKKTLQTSEETLSKCAEDFKAGLLAEQQEFAKEVEELLQKFTFNGPTTPDWLTLAAIDWLRAYKIELDEKLAKDTRLRTDLIVFDILHPYSPELVQIQEDIEVLNNVWLTTLEWDIAWEGYKTALFWKVKTEDMEMTAQSLYKTFTTMVRDLRDRDWPIVEHSRKRVDDFRRVLPLINDLKNSAMRKRHWDAVRDEMKSDFDEKAPTFTLELIIDIKMQDFADFINETSNAATMELNIENNLLSIKEQWSHVNLDIVPHKEKGVYRLKGVDDIFQLLEEHQTSLSAMKGTRFVRPFLAEVEYWEKNLCVVLEVLEAGLTVQRLYLYLENIFYGEDIRKQLPVECHEFDKITSSWRSITTNMYQDKNAFKATHYPGLLKTLEKMVETLEKIQKALEQYLETKRYIFPRFYFISNDDLLEILGNSKRPQAIQPHFKKCFDNINKVNLQKHPYYNRMEALGMYSADGEYINWSKTVTTEGPVELWLCKIEDVMRITLRDLLKLVRTALRKNLARRDLWIKEWCGQLCITASQIQWTTSCTRTLLNCKALGRKTPLKRLRKKQNRVLAKFSEALRGDMSKVQRLKVVALVTIEIHARDVIDKMYRTNCMDVSAFEWLSQLRFYWDRDLDDCVVRQTNTHFMYGYEYLGNSGRLVITPLTDRCYITLTTALHLFRGGSPKGPAGTGKTETVKDLGKGLAYYVIVINCSEGLDYKSMGRMFSGLAQTGAWGCFDEFNRINIEVLSVVAQQILSIISALAQGLKKFSFEGASINLISTCGIFITMNPGYAGRTELPDNLKSMFRPISMMVPDSMLIAEITLFGEGFRETRVLAKKAYTLFALSMQQLSKQDHYDFGLRGMVSLLRYAGKKRRLLTHMSDEEVVLLAMKDMNVAKLTSDDLPLFNGITRDLFPGIELPAVDYEVMYNAMREECKKSNLQEIPNLFIKVIQLYETKGSRHSVMIVGATGSAKSTTWRMLKATHIALKRDEVPGFERVQEYLINPKAVNLGELYGEFNLATNEWSDGILSNIMRKTCADEGADEKWILFDGPVDAVWIENMNSVMDDNKVLTLINSERITMPEQVSLLFEVGDLAVASPATVSRCGMVFNDYKDFGWTPYVQSWLAKHTEEVYRELMWMHCEKYVNNFLNFVRLHCIQTVTVPEICFAQSLCRLLQILCPPVVLFGKETPDVNAHKLLSKMWFLFCLLWSLGGSVNEEGRIRIDKYIRELENVFPLNDTVYEYYVDTSFQSFQHWDQKLPETWRYNPEEPFFKIIVPTVDTVRYEFLTAHLLRAKFPVLLVGVVGTGKTSCAYSVLDNLDPERYSLLAINMSAQTTSLNVQDTIESRVEKRTKGVYYPFGGKHMITFMDDFNMPAKEVYGAQPPLELIRQWLDYGFWYNRRNQTSTSVRDMLLLTAMGPPGGGRNTISERLMTRFCVINLTFPQDSQIFRIFNTMLVQHTEKFDKSVKELSENLTNMTVKLYKEVIVNMLPTPAKMHYLFNLRDISKVFQGLLRSSTDYQNGKQEFLRLWVHEAFRVFNDRLIDDHDQEWFFDQIGEMLADFFEMTFPNICPTQESPIFCEFMNQYSMYEDIQDLVALRSHVERQLDDYNNSPGVVHVDLVFFKEALEHITRIARVLSQPRGHMLLVGIGGSGRQSLGRIGAWLCQYSTYQIQITRTYKTLDFKEDLKKIYYKTGVKDSPLSFLFTDTQVAEETFLEIINNVLSTGEVPNLYKPDEFDEIKTVLFDVIKRTGLIPTAETTYSFLIDRVRANLHITICLSPVGDSFRVRLRQYPSLINCTTIDWFLDWPRPALLEVASKYMQEIDMNETITGEAYVEKAEEAAVPRQERMRQGAASVCATMHDSVAKYSKKMLLELKRHNYVTPTNFLELVARYKENLSMKRLEIAQQANKLRNGLSKLEETRVKVQEMSVELEKATIEVAKMNKECDEFLVKLMNQKREVDEQTKTVAARSIVIEAEEKECQALADIARADLQLAMPALEEAIKALDALNKKDLTEIKSYGRPPYKVEMVMEAVMILKQVQPTWAEAKRQLGDVNFLNQLKDFDKDHITDKTLKRVGLYTSKADFEPEKVGVVSVAAKSLAMWVIAIEKYGKIYKIVAPKKAKLEEAMSSLREKQKALADAKAKLEQLQKLMQELQVAYDEKMAQKEELKRRAEILKMKLERAAELVEGLAGERERWGITVVYLDGQFDFLPGDCLLATAFVSYMGPFVSNFREALTNVWKKQVLEEDLPCDPKFNVCEFLAKPTQIREWNIQGLPLDMFSTENGIITKRGTRWPLIIDPQSQAWRWIRNMEAPNGLKVVDFGMPDFMKIIEVAMRKGKPVLLQNVLETLDPSVSPVLSKAIVIKGEQYFLKLGDRLVDYNMNFRFFVTTKLPNPHFVPEISTKTTLINFAIKPEGLEQQLLAKVVREEKPKLEEQKNTLVLNIASGKQTLIELEDELLRLLNESEGSILDNMELLITLRNSKKTAQAVKEQLETSITTEIEIDIAREGYRPCARRASILYFVLNDLALIDPMYQFSLDSYMDLFLISIHKSKQSENLDERINHLNGYHTYFFYRNTCRGLFERHKLLFSFYMCVKILEARNEIKMSDYSYLLTGGVVLNRDQQASNPAPEWITEEAWDNVTELDKEPGFHGVVKSFVAKIKDWKEWYYNNEPENTPLIGEWNEACTEFQKMLFIRAIRPDRLSFCITAYVAISMGAAFTDPPVLDIRSVLEDSICKTPLIFVLSPGVDPTNALLQLAENAGMSAKFQTLSLGQGQAPIATKIIADGIVTGDWVFLANCHLSLSWMPALDKIVELFQSNPNVHPNFRLWLSSSPHPQFPISILQSSLKMTTEPPKGLRANMRRLYNMLTEEQMSVCKCQNKYRKLLFSLVFFHAILIERKKFQQLGWNVIYSFNDSDFEVSENILALYLDEYTDTPWDALKYLIAGVCYGGHVTDDWDRRLLHTYINCYFNDYVLTEQSYKLSELDTYYVPVDATIDHYHNVISALPATDLPQAFGQHPNADITSQIIETRALCETLMALQGSESSTEEGSNKEEKVMLLSSEVIEKLPNLIDYETTERIIGKSKAPLDVVLLQEIQRYNVLLSSITESLKSLQKGIKGFVVMSADLEEIFTCIYEGRVPPAWLNTYPSMKMLGSWARDLVSRVSHFKTWADTAHPPLFFWLSAFTFPTGFLTAVLQTSARQLGVSIDTLGWEFTPQSRTENDIQIAPVEGVYVIGMYLEGAGWDPRNLTLSDPVPMQLVCQMPIILFRPCEQTKRRVKGLYNCPVYYFPLRCGMQGREAFVVAVDLKTGNSTSDHWIKRGTAILLSLSA